MGRKKKLINHTQIPDHDIEAIALAFLPDIIAYYNSEEGQREFAEWKAKRAGEKPPPQAEKKPT